MLCYFSVSYADSYLNILLSRADGVGGVRCQVKGTKGEVGVMRREKGAL